MRAIENEFESECKGANDEFEVFPPPFAAGAFAPPPPVVSILHLNLSRHVLFALDLALIPPNPSAKKPFLCLTRAERARLIQGQPHLNRLGANQKGGVRRVGGHVCRDAEANG